MNVLVVVAHHDDLELGCGGTVAKLVENGHAVTSLVLTHSGYENCTGEVIRSKGKAAREGMAAATVLGYKLINLEEDTFDLEVKDENLCKILNVIEQCKADTILTHWHGDTHPPHHAANVMVMHATRNVPNVYGFAVNWYSGTEVFCPRVFVAIEDVHWERRESALRQYETEFARTGSRWLEYSDRQTLNYGVQAGVKRAEGLVVYKSLWAI